MQARKEAGPTSVFYTDVPAHHFDAILGRPTRNSVPISVLGYSASDNPRLPLSQTVVT
ncbi:MAG: hypothetical protein GY851_01110 [bacterium]|nr:hypothetical protein [bacterium]